MMRGLALIALLAVAFSSPIRAQDTAQERTAVTIDFVSVDGIYLAIGADQGLALGDTVGVFADALTGQVLGSLVFTSVTRRRSVARTLDPSLQLARGDVVFMVLGGATASAPEPVPVPVRAAVAAIGAQAPGRRPIPSGPRVSGRIALEFDARETRTSWSGDLFGDTRRRFATPTSRLSLVVADLPGGFSIRTNLRASYRYYDLANGPSPTSLRAYELAAVKSFDRVPFEVRIGRFTSPHESYSAYWDGILMRLGRSRGPGLGVVAGFEPSLYNEGFSSSLPKLTGFADYAARGSGWRYDTDVSVHLMRPTTGPDWNYFGWSQSITLGPLSVRQRLRVDGGLDGREWTLSDLRLRAQVAVIGPLGLHGGYGKSRGAALFPEAILEELSAPIAFIPRQEISAGLDMHGRRGSVWVDVGQTDRDGSESGRSLSGNTSLAVGGGQLLVSGQHWQRGDAKSLGLSPAIAFSLGSTRWRAGYRYYRTEGITTQLTSNAVDAQVSTNLANALRVTLGGEQQWGANLQGTRIRLGLWRSF